jgi:hypothetical protein
VITINLMGGLGNQMFQYALGRSVAETNDVKLYLDKAFLENRTPGFVNVFRDYELDLFPNIIENTTDHSTINYTKVFEPHFHHAWGLTEAKLQPEQHVYLTGYWQSYKYFENIESIIRHDFSFPEIKETRTENLRQKIMSENSVMINVRRSDYLTDSLFEDLTMEYFNECIEKIEALVDQPTFYVFSDDIEWCKKNFTDEKFFVVDKSYAGKKYIDYLNLMSSCKHQIIPNSTFAWWAAWLNSNENKIVMYPSKWFTDPSKDTKDLCPTDWIKV